MNKSIWFYVHTLRWKDKESKYDGQSYLNSWNNIKRTRERERKRERVRRVGKRKGEER